MIKRCPACNKKKEMRSNQKYCNKKCKYTFENSKRSAPGTKNIIKGRKVIKMMNNPKPIPPKSIVTASSTVPNPFPSHQSACKIACPSYLNSIAAEYWEKIAPTVIERGHLNILSEDAFAEMCDNYSRLRDVNRAIDETNRDLLQIIDQWDNKKGKPLQQVKESALSDLKRKYSKLFLEYQNRFYLTPLVNRGNFGLDDHEEVDPHDEFLSMSAK